jgi:signal transduction histidine kinase
MDDPAPNQQRLVLEAVVETVPNGILVIDEERNFFTYNQNFIDMWQIPDDVVEAGSDQEALESVLEELEQPDEFLETVEYFYEHPEEVGRDVIHLGDGRIFERYTAPARDEDGTYHGRVWVFEDITDRRQYKQELQRQNDRLEEFVSVVSHDLRNPLNVAMARSELIGEECDSDHLDVVARAHDRMESLIEDLLMLAKEGEASTDIGPVDLERVIEDCWRNVSTAAATLVADTDQTIQADEERLKQLIENLVRNAVEHGGTDITVRVGGLDDGFYIADDGPGIAPSNREQVFDAGYTKSDTGTGYGLYIVSQVTEAHGWDITVTDSHEGGARFEITNVKTTQ